MIFWYFCKIFVPRSEGPPLSFYNQMNHEVAISPFPIVSSKDLFCRHVKPGFVCEKVKQKF